MESCQVSAVDTCFCQQPHVDHIKHMFSQICLSNSALRSVTCIIRATTLLDSGLACRMV